MSSGSTFLLIIVFENRFSGKTYIYTIGSRPRDHRQGHHVRHHLRRQPQDAPTLKGEACTCRWLLRRTECRGLLVTFICMVQQEGILELN